MPLLPASISYWFRTSTRLLDKLKQMLKNSVMHYPRSSKIRLSLRLMEERSRFRHVMKRERLLLKYTIQVQGSPAKIFRTLSSDCIGRIKHALKILVVSDCPLPH